MSQFCDRLLAVLRDPPAAGSSIVDYALITWLTLTIPFLLGSPWEHLAGHIVGIALIVGVRRWLLQAPPRRALLLRWAHALYAYPILTFVYKEVDLLQRHSPFDPLVQAWEQGLFGGQPALWLSQALPWWWLSEVLHLCYASYYLILPTLGFTLLWWGQRREFQCLWWTAVVTLLVTYGIAVVFPVTGPRPLLPPLDESLRGPYWALSHRLLSQAAAHALAFPSGHVAQSAVVTLCAWRWCRPIFPLILIWSGGVAIATVYGRFHYVVDALAGLALAPVMAWLGPLSFDRLTASRPRSGA